MSIRLLDIEGTIGDIAFVRQVLFPFAEARFEIFLAEHGHEPEIAAIIASTGAPDFAGALEKFRDWSAKDVKAPPLKALQGKIWRLGYDSGELKAHLYADAIDAIRAWHRAGIAVAIYSSGSIEAQKLYFAHTIVGDLTGLISAWFDTTSGAKNEAESYRRIAAALNAPPRDVRFLSDAPAEVAAAQAAGCQAARIDRNLPPNTATKDAGGQVFGALSVARLDPLWD